MKKIIVFILVLASGCSLMTRQQSDRSTRSVADQSSLLRIVSGSDLTAIDPHAQFLDPNINLSFQIFEALTMFGPNKELLPGLAEKWELTQDPKVWMFHLRQDARFHSGEKFDKNDFLETLWRVTEYASDRPSGYMSNVQKIDLALTRELNSKNTDSHQLLIATKTFERFLPHNLASIVILQRQNAKEAQQMGQTQGSKAVMAEFAKGRWVSGTGPYRFKSWTAWQPGMSEGQARVELTAFSSRRSDQQISWEQVHYLVIPDHSKRLAAVQEGRAEVAVAVPPTLGAVKRLQSPGLRVIHLQLFQGHDDRETRLRAPGQPNLHSPVKDQLGNSFANPLVSLNFRRALAYAVDKQRLVQVVKGQGKPTEQYMQPGQAGYLSGIPESRFNLKAARQSFTKAATEPGFEFLTGKHLTFEINGPEGRYFMDKEVLQALAQMWTEAFTFEVGNKHYSIEFKAKTEPMSTYTQNARSYLVSLLGGGVDNGQGEAVLRLYLTPGSSLNYASYSNPEISRLYALGTQSQDTKIGDRAFEQALRLALIDQQAMIPVYNTIESWIVKEGICFEPRKDGLTLAKFIKIQPDCVYVP